VRIQLSSSYPEGGGKRDAWILAHRPERNVLDPRRPYLFFVEQEHSAAGEIVPVATIFLTNRECPWRCLMCDLWRNTLDQSVPEGAILEQVEYALDQLGPAREIKLYNSGSFFDVRAIPLNEYQGLTKRIASFERVIVESHPALVGDNCLQFKENLRGRLEVAMGLETVHPEILERLNKRMNLGQFEAAAKFLQKNDMDLRVFILVKPPFMKEEEALEWAVRSLDFAFDCGATAATLIPTRAGNGALEELASQGEFAPPSLGILEAAAEYGLSLKRGRVFADLWNVGATGTCPSCYERRVARLAAMNRQQQSPGKILCASCEAPQ
jgi:archaeosine synthase beta-subunit